MVHGIQCTPSRARRGSKNGCTAGGRWRARFRPHTGPLVPSSRLRCGPRLRNHSSNPCSARSTMSCRPNRAWSWSPAEGLRPIPSAPRAPEAAHRPPLANTYPPQATSAAAHPKAAPQEPRRGTQWEWVHPNSAGVQTRHRASGTEPSVRLIRATPIQKWRDQSHQQSPVRPKIPMQWPGPTWPQRPPPAHPLARLTLPPAQSASPWPSPAHGRGCRAPEPP